MSNNLPENQTSKGLMKPVHNNIATSVEAADIQIPKILLMQGLSDLVAEQKAAMGDFVDSLTGEKLGDAKNPVKLYPIAMWKDFLITEKRGNKFEFKEIVPYTTANAHWRDAGNWNYTDNGVEHRRALRMNYAVLLERDKDDFSAFPYTLSFQVTGINAGKGFANLFVKAERLGKKPWYFTVGLGAKLEKNDKGTFYTPTVASAVQTPDFDQVNEVCSQWEAIFKQGGAKIDESDVATTQEAGPSSNRSGGSETRF